MISKSSDRISYFASLLQKMPTASAAVFGGPAYPDITGRINFYQTKFGVLVSAQVFGLPRGETNCRKRIFALHIHDGSSCTGTAEDAFADAGTHYNLDGCRHPDHAGDLLPLWGNDGYAFSTFLTDRFSVGEVLGKTVIIHAGSDDFTTQPAGNAGQKIACGIIVRHEMLRPM